MTRRSFILLLSALRTSETVTVPLCLVRDTKAKLTREANQDFWGQLWPQAVGNFAAGGIRLEWKTVDGTVERPPGRQPVVTGLDPARLNLVLTSTIPMEWDSGRSLSGVTLRYRGLHVSMISLYRAHGHLMPLISVNTCVHEILHALMLDIYDVNPQGLTGAEREFRIDYLASRLWLFHDGSGIRGSARKYVERLKADALPWLTGPRR